MSRNAAQPFGVLLLLLSAAAAMAEDDRLRRAGIESTPRGVQAYLEEYLKPADEKEPATLIPQLGAETFRDRERAMDRLATIGFPAFKEIEAATRHADPEIAWRAKAVLITVRNGGNRSSLIEVLKFVETERMAVGLPLLLRVRDTSTSDEVRAACDAAMEAIIVESDRAVAAKLVKEDSVDLRNLGRRLLTRLDPAVPAPLLEGIFDAVKVKVGNVAGGGPNLIDGWEFQPKADLRVTHLGILDHGADGLNIAHPVAIWELENAKAPVAELTVPEGAEAPLTGVFRMLPLDEPAKLSAGKRYAVVALYPETKAMDVTVGLINPTGLTVEFTSHLEIFGRRYAFPHKAMAYPAKSDEGANRATLGPTFRYEVVPD